MSLMIILSQRIAHISCQGQLEARRRSAAGIGRIRLQIVHANRRFHLTACSPDNHRCGVHKGPKFPWGNTGANPQLAMVAARCGPAGRHLSPSLPGDQRFTGGLPQLARRGKGCASGLAALCRPRPLRTWLRRPSPASPWRPHRSRSSSTITPRPASTGGFRFIPSCRLRAPWWCASSSAAGAASSSISSVPWGRIGASGRPAADPEPPFR
jgi:hypothetical protein